MARRVLRLRIGVVGAGSMAQAFVSGLLGSGLASPSMMQVNNRRNEDERRFFLGLGVGVAMDKAALSAASDVLVLAVKPADAAEALKELAPHVLRRHLVLSLMAGIPSAYVAERLGGRPRVLRAMANTSSAVRESATAVAKGPGATARDLSTAMGLLQALGHVVPIEERLLDSVTALAGSGPAYVCLLIESMVAAGRLEGLSDEVAQDLALQTVYGAAKMVRETGMRPEDLRRRVSSPGGTTLAALEVLEAAGFRESMARAVRRARERSGELGRTFLQDGDPPQKEPSLGSR